MFSQHLSETRKNQACQNQGSVFNIIVTAVKTVNITWNQREKRRTSLGQVWGEETGPTSFCHPRRLEVPTCFHFRGPAETWWCPNQGSGDPKGRIWGGGGTLETVGVFAQVQGLETVWVSPHPHGSGSCTQRPHTCSSPAVCLVSSEIPSV